MRLPFLRAPRRGGWAGIPAAVGAAGNGSAPVAQARDEHADSEATPAADRQERRVLAARAEVISTYADLARGKRNWQVMAFAAIALLGVQMFAYVRLADSVRVVPFIVRADSVGGLMPIGYAAQMRGTEQRLIAAQLAHVIRNLRTVLPAAAASAQDNLTRSGFAFVEQGSSAVNFLAAYYADPRNDPRVLGQSAQRQVQRVSALPVPNSNTWRVRWTEHEVPLQAGVMTRTSDWEGYVTVRIDPPATEQRILENPIGLYITALSWTELTEGRPQ